MGQTFFPPSLLAVVAVMAGGHTLDWGSHTPGGYTFGWDAGMYLVAVFQRSQSRNHTLHCGTGAIPGLELS